MKQFWKEYAKDDGKSTAKEDETDRKLEEDKNIKEAIKKAEKFVKENENKTKDDGKEKAIVKKKEDSKGYNIGYKG